MGAGGGGSQETSPYMSPAPRRLGRPKDKGPLSYSSLFPLESPSWGPGTQEETWVPGPLWLEAEGGQRPGWACRRSPGGLAVARVGSWPITRQPRLVSSGSWLVSVDLMTTRLGTKRAGRCPEGRLGRGLREQSCLEAPLRAGPGCHPHTCPRGPTWLPEWIQRLRPCRHPTSSATCSLAFLGFPEWGARRVPGSWGAAGGRERVTEGPPIGPTASLLEGF